MIVSGGTYGSIIYFIEGDAVVTMPASTASLAAAAAAAASAPSSLAGAAGAAGAVNATTGVAAASSSPYQQLVAESDDPLANSLLAIGRRLLVLCPPFVFARMYSDIAAVTGQGTLDDNSSPDTAAAAAQQTPAPAAYLCVHAAACNER